MADDERIRLLKVALITFLHHYNLTNISNFLKSHSFSVLRKIFYIEKISPTIEHEQPTSVIDTFLKHIDKKCVLKKKSKVPG